MDSRTPPCGGPSRASLSERSDRSGMGSCRALRAPARRGGRKPRDLPPKSTAHDYFILLDRDGALQRMHEALYLMAREQAGREASPTAAIIDSQSAKAAQKGALDWTRKDMTRARKSPAANATSSSTRSGFC